MTMEDAEIKDLARYVASIIKRDIKPVYDKPLYTTKEAALFLGVKQSYIYELVRKNKISYYRSKGGKLIFIRREQLIKWATAISVPELSKKPKHHQS